METISGEKRKKPVFSVIMPCYNSENYIREALESITGQTYPYWELVAVNDGSKDSTPAILKEYAEKDHRIRVLSKENGGYISAVNMGLEHITGDYFLMMGSDDALAGDLFYELDRCMEEGAADCIAFRSVCVKDGEMLGVEHVTNFLGAVSMFDTTLAEYSQQYPKHAEILFTRDTSKCYKRALLGDLRYFGKYGFDADGIFSMLLCHNAGSFAAIPVDGYYWTLRGDSLSGRKSFPAQDRDRIRNWTQFYQHLLKMETEHIAQAEREYLHYFLGIVNGVWRSASPFPAGYQVVRDAVHHIRKIQKKTGYDMDLSLEHRLLLRAPIVWKLYISLTGWARDLLKRPEKD